MTIEKAFFKEVVGQFATGVTVVTTGSQGKVAGITVNTFCSVSLNPPLVLVCVDLISQTLQLIRESGIFAVNILSSEQDDLSRCFAGASRERYEYFCNATYSEAATGAPILDGTLAFIDARVVAEYPGGDHVIFLGQVEALGTGSKAVFADESVLQQATVESLAKDSEREKMPLAYYRGKYRHLNAHYAEPSMTQQSISEIRS
jgi:flavin reductase (DIM6/NTAB) family NADH-FMN oxidoreductase RutF